MSVKWKTRRKSEEELERENEAMADAIAELAKASEQKKADLEAAERAKAPKFKRRF
jgi:hypothetical protein